MTTKTVPSFLFISLLALMPAAAGAPAHASLVLPDMSSTRLLNDLQVYVASTPYLGESMTIGLVVRYGSAFDPANKGGEAYLTSRMLAKATLDKTAKDIQDELALLKATVETRCDWDGIRILMQVPSAAYERSLLLLYQVVCEAKFEEADLAQVKAELMKQLQAPEDARQRARSLFEAELFRGTTYGRSLRGSPASVQKILIGDVRYFHRHYFSPDQTSLVVVGSAPAQTVLQKVRRIWGVWVRSEEIPFTFLPPREPAARNIFLEDDPGSPGAQFILGNLWPGRGDAQYYPSMLAVRILQERLTRALPTSLLTVAAEGRRLHGPFFVQGQAAADQAVGEIERILDAVETLKTSGVSAEEVSKAQAQSIEEFDKSITSTEGICGALLDAELYRLGINYLATFPEFVQRSTPAAVKEAAKRFLMAGGLVLIVRGPAATLKPQLEALGTVQALKR